MPPKILIVDRAKCTGCHSCEVWCSFHHFQVCNPSLARLTIIADEEKGLFVPEVCYHCKDPWCMNVCPADAITRDEDTGAVIISQELCTGCLACVDACPFQVIKVGTEGLAFKCDLCEGNPACVWSCTRGAITYSEATGEYLERANARAGRAGGKI